MTTAARTTMHFLGKERFKHRRYGWQEKSYYAIGDKIEERELTGDGKSWSIRRYTGIDPATLEAIAAKVKALSDGDRNSSGGHDELMKILGRYPYLNGFVDLDKIDDPDRKVIAAGGMNMQPLSPEDHVRFFSLGANNPTPKQAIVDRIRANFPAELIELDQWLVWRLETRKGKPTKVPYTVAGTLASSTDPTTWATFEQATQAYLDAEYSGVGFVFSEADPYCGTDLDKCIAAGAMEPQRAAWMRQLGSYSERSPSGKGAHVFARGKLPPEKRKSTKYQVEMYDSGRFFTVTGDHIEGTPTRVEERQAEIEQLHAEIFGKASPTATHKSKLSDEKPAAATGDEELLAKVFASKHGADIRALWDGNMGRYVGPDGAPDHSSADLALCNHLAYWTRHDEGQMDRLFRRSALYRPEKWDRAARTGETYGQGTIRKAIEGTDLDVTPIFHTNGTGPGSPPRAASTNGTEEPPDMPDWAPTDEDAPSAEPTGKVAGKAGGGEKAKTTTADYHDALARLGYSFAWNDLDDSLEVNGRPIDAGVAAEIRCMMRDRGFMVAGHVEDAYTYLGHLNRYHPVKRRLESLTWDGGAHLAKLCSYIEDAHAPIVYPDGTALRVAQAWLKRWMLGAVARVFESRVQNPMLVLNGGQDLGKSYLTAWLASPFAGYFIEAPIRPDDKEHERLMATKFLWEVAELGATTRRADREALKAFVTKGEVTFRKPYDRHPIVKPTLANFVGTINSENGFLTDPTGNRRFLTVTLTKLNWGYEKAVDPAQLWAEALHYYRQGAKWQLSQTERQARDGLNQTFEREDPHQEMLIKYFDIDPTRQDWFCFTADIVDRLRTMGAKDADQTLYNGVGVACRRLGLESARKVVGNQRGRGYYGIAPKP